ncbi:MAG: hypothetical protein QXM96_04220, partial [Candidatus Woesearchaeota archaeon]
MQKTPILLKKIISKSHAINPRKKKHGFFFFFFLNFVFFLFFLNFVLSVDSLPVSLTPENATTLDNLICSWNTTTFQKVNVTWYNGTNIYSEIKETTSIQVLSSFIAKKNEIWNCSVVEWNNSLNYGSAKTTIVNAPPYQPNVINDSIEEDSLYSRDIATTDPDNDALISYMCVPSKFSITESTISWQPVSSDVEPLSSKLYNFTCIAFDSDFSSSSKKFFLNVTAKNDKPYFVSLNNATKNESQKLQHIISVSDEENPSGLFNLSFNSYNCPYNPVSVFEINRTSNNSFIFQVINNQTLTINEIGNCTINLTLYDPLTTSVNHSELFNIEVITTNHLPNFTYIESKDRYYNQTENFQLLINATDIDENELLSFTITTPYCSVSPWNITLLNNSNNASALIKAFPLNESHIKCKIINLKVIDSKNAYSNITLELNVSNVNDAPVINELSFHINNSFSNKNLTNLSAYSFVEFTYYVNATDIDIDYQTDLTDYLTYDSNSTLCIDCPYFLINPNTGEINFTPNETHIGKTFSYKVNVSDKYGLFDEKILIITILNNSIPFFNQSLPNIYAKEDLLYTLKINASDLEDKNVSFYINTTLFNISNQGLINFTPTCLDVGNYSVLIKIFDSFGAENSTIINVSINMSPDMPFISTLQNITLFEDEIFSTYLIASDDDLTCNQFDNLIFNYSFINGNETNFTLFNLENQNNSGNYKSLLTLQAKDKGNFLINFSVQDLYNYKSSMLWNISVINRSNVPIINNITPFGSPYTNFSSSWKPVSDFSGSYTTINISENMTIYFNHNTTDLDNDNLNFTWLKNNNFLNNSKNISYYFDFDSSGNHNITLIVSDIRNNKTANNVSFSWNINVKNLNRQPYLNNSLPNITVN